MLTALLLCAPLTAPPLLAEDPPTVVGLTTSDELELQADYYLPKKREGRVPAALLVHDAGSNGATLTAIAERLQKQGFAVLVPDLRGHGRSATDDHDWSSCDEEARERLWAFATRDLDACAAFLREQKEVHSTNLSLVGVRAGNTLAVRHALRDENVRSLGLIAPRPQELGFDLEEDIQELAGLPVYLVAQREAKSAAEDLVSLAHAAANEREYIELMIASRAKSEDCLDDRKLPASLAKWLHDKAFPRRGGRGGDDE